MATTLDAAAVSDDREGSRVFSLIPEMSHPDGPVTRRRWRRTISLFVCAWVVGALPLLLNASPSWKAFGLGMILPGGGFLYTAHPIWAGVSLLLFPLSIGLLWGLGPVLVPPAIWIGSAVLAATSTTNHLWLWAQPVVPLMLVTILTAARLRQRRSFARASEQGRALNEELRNTRFAIAAAPANPPVTESSPDDLAALRYALDLALQPIDRWDGHNIIDQFRESALRYQLQFIQYACAMSQYTRTPAFTGYLAEAQRNTIEKMLDPIVWKYWRWENLWGNLRWDPDPVVRDNVMLSGYWAVMVGLYESLTGDHRYNKPGSLTFRNGDKEIYPYDFPKLAQLMHRNLTDNPWCMFPCEPSWIYPFCNSYALNTLILHDRLHGSGYSKGTLEGFRQSFEADFIRPDGRVIGIKNGRWGFNLPTAAAMSDAALVFWFNPFMPAVAQRIWWTLRRQTMSFEDGELRLRMSDFDRVDAGNYTISRSGWFSRALLQYAAREMGDEEIYQGLHRSFDRDCALEQKDGVRRYPKISVYGNAQHTLARFTRKNALREMISFNLPKAWREGPMLAEAAYPDVLVAKAVTDGRALDLVLRPGDKGGRTSLALGRLMPSRRYRLDGATSDSVTAKADGTATIEVELNARIEVHVKPLD